MIWKSGSWLIWHTVQLVGTCADEENISSSSWSSSKKQERKNTWERMKKNKARDSGAEPWEHAKKNSKGCKLKIRGSKINRHQYTDGTKGKILKPRGKMANTEQ